MINIKNHDPNKIKRDEKSYKIIAIYYTGYVMIKDLSYTKINNVNSLYLIINKTNGHIKESSRNYLMLVPPDESKDKLKKYEELWNKIRDLIGSITTNLDNYDEKHVKIKLN